MQINFLNNGVFFLIAVVNSLVCYALFGLTGSVFGVLTVLFTHIVYAAKPDNKNIIYVWFLLSLVLLGGGIGYLLKLSVGFYLFLFLFSCFYYIIYNKDAYIDRVVPFFIIFSCMGTTLPAVSAELPLAYLTGITVSLLILGFFNRKNKADDPFINGLFAKGSYTGNKNILLRAFVYSLFLFLTLFIPDHFDLYRPYWAPLTFIVLLRPKEMSIIKITFSRFAGSVMGAIFLLMLYFTFGFGSLYVYFGILIIAVFLLPTFLNANYVLKTFAITFFVLLLLEETEFLHDPTYLLPVSRVYETFIGGSIAILASLVLNALRHHRANSDDTNEPQH